MPASNVLTRNTVGGTALRTVLATSTAVVAADPVADVLTWGIGLIVANNGWIVPAPIASLLVIGVSTAVQAGWRWLTTRSVPQS